MDQKMNKPVAHLYPEGEGCTVYDINFAWSVQGTTEPIPLYTQEQLEEARKLGMQQERALWNLTESTQEIMNTHPVKEQKCIVKDCENHKHEGGFVGDLCKPCHQFITTGEGVYSQAYRNAHPVKELTLTDEDILEEWTCKYSDCYQDTLIEFARAILRKAQEK